MQNSLCMCVCVCVCVCVFVFVFITNMAGVCSCNVTMTLSTGMNWKKSFLGELLGVYSKGKVSLKVQVEYKGTVFLG